jgi:cytochrome c-type biogenesis protein CcmH/NrfG
VEKGLSLARTKDTRTLGWLLLADVYSRRGQSERAQQALMHARERAPTRKNGASP